MTMEVKMNLFFLGMVGLSLLMCFTLGWGQCPGQPHDNGICDTLYLEVYPRDTLFTNPGNFVRVLIRVTHDNPNAWDSLAGIVTPFCFTHSNPAKYCSLSYYWNNSVSFTNPRSIFRHLVANRDTIHNWMMDQFEEGNGEEWNLISLNLDGASHFWLSLLPFGTEDQKFGPGSKVLLATMTFKVEDTMTIWIDSCFWPPSSRLKFVRSDAWAYIPRHNLPYCFSIIPWIPPEIQLTSPAQDQLNVPVSSNISVTFDTTMDETSINASTFIVNARSTGRHQGTISYDSLTRTATFDPSMDFNLGDVVTTTLTTDILTANGIPMKRSYVWSFSVMVSKGGGTFALDSIYLVGDGPQSLFAADLDKDDDLDLVIANVNSDNVTVLLNNGKGIFFPDSVYPVDDEPRTVITADLNGDGYLDLVTSNSNASSVSVLLNNGDGNFAPHSDYPAGSWPNCVFAADLDGDGDLDLATANTGANNVSVLLNNGNGAFATHLVYPAGDGPRSVFAADLDGDGDLDLATANSNSNNVSVLLNQGDGTFAPQLIYHSGDTPTSVFAADLDADGYLDVVTANASSDNVSVLWNNGDGTFAPQTVYPVGDTPTSVFAADLNGDGDVDLAIANQNFNNVSILLNNGNGTFAPSLSYPISNGTQSIFSADMDDDGDLDLAIASTDSNQVSIMLNFIRGDINGDGVINIGDMIYLINYLFKNGPPSSPLSAGDTNCDGAVNVLDGILLINYLFRGGSAPSC